MPGRTLDQAADCSVAVPVRETWRPWAKSDCLLFSSEAVPQLPLMLVLHALVVTETVDPVVLTEIPETAAAEPAATGRKRAEAAATVRPERRNSGDLRIWVPSGGTVGGTSLAPPRVGNARAASGAANAPGVRPACGRTPVR